MTRSCFFHSIQRESRLTPSPSRRRSWRIGLYRWRRPPGAISRLRQARRKTRSTRPRRSSIVPWQMPNAIRQPIRRRNLSTRSPGSAQCRRRNGSFSAGFPGVPRITRRPQTRPHRSSADRSAGLHLPQGHRRTGEGSSEGRPRRYALNRPAWSRKPTMSPAASSAERWAVSIRISGCSGAS